MVHDFVIIRHNTQCFRLDSECIKEDKVLQILFIFVKCKKHFIKVLKDVGMVVPKIKETRL